MRKRGIVFYSVLALLTAAIIGCFAAWSFTKNDLPLFLMLGLFVFYILFLVLALKENKKRAQGISAELGDMHELLASESVRSVFFSVYSMKRALKPRAGTRDYYIETHSSSDAEQLTAHYAGKLSEEVSRAIEEACTGAYAVSFAVIAGIRGKKIICASELYEAIKPLPEYEQFIKQNKFYLYRENSEGENGEQA